MNTPILFQPHLQPHPHARIPDIINKRFNSLIVLSLAGMVETSGQRHSVWICQCDCGNTCLRQIKSLTDKKWSSCGCHLKKRRIFGPSLRLDFPREYSIWNTMWQRCTNPRDRHFILYGGRGITVDQCWENFNKFMVDMKPRPSDKHSIDRKNNNLGYSKDNCHWVIQSVQIRNTRRNIILTHNGITQCLKDWAIMLGISPATFRYRLNHEWPEEQLFSVDRFTKKRKSTINVQISA
jgi:hypothetical protein